jgi:plastocyanin
MKKYGGILLMATVCALAACTGSGNVPTNTGANADITQSLGMGTSLKFTLPPNTIGEELPNEGVGTEQDPTWGLVGGFTQTTKAQVLAFPPGTKITIMNLSGSITHTLDFVKKVMGPPAKFPQNPTLSIPAKGNGMFEKGYASGPISPGKSVTMTLVKPGNYLIGCAYHYAEGMQDVLRVKAKATPGPSIFR